MRNVRKALETIRKIMSLMEKEGLTKEEASLVAKILPEKIERNNELIEKSKPFITYKPSEDIEEAWRSCPNTSRK